MNEKVMFLYPYPGADEPIDMEFSTSDSEDFVLGEDALNELSNNEGEEG